MRFGSKVSVVETAFCAQPRRTLVEQRNDRPMTDHRHPLQTNSPPKASSTPFSRETESSVGPLAAGFEFRAWRVAPSDLPSRTVRTPSTRRVSPRLFARISLLVSLACVLGAAPAAARDDAPVVSSSGVDREQDGDAAKRADEAFNAGVAAYRRGDYLTAREAFTRAYELEPSYRAAAVLGQTEERLGNLAQAASLLNWALYNLDSHVEPEANERMKADLSILKDRVLTLKLRTQVPFKEVLIDDLLFTSNSVRVLPESENTWTIYLDPSNHEVVVRAEGYRPQQRRVSAPAGTAIDWELRWEETSAGDAPGPKPGSEGADTTQDSAHADFSMDRVEPARWQLPAAIVTGGLALIGAGYGFYELSQHASAVDEMDRARAALAASGIAAPCGAGTTAATSSACSELATAADDRVTHGNRATVALSAAGALALTSAVLWIWWANTDDHSVARLRVSPVLHTAYVGGTIGGRF